MKAVATTSLPPAQAMSLSQKITASMIAIMCDPQEDTFYLSGNYRTGNILNSDGDWTGAQFGLRAVPRI